MCSNKRVYLAGSMSNLKSFGVGWRQKIKKYLDNHGISCYDPTTEEIGDHKNYEIKKENRHKWEELPQELQEKILKKDLDQITKNTNYVICYFTRYSTGTVSELTVALYHKIPVYLVSTRKLVGWPSTVAHAEGNKVFRTFSELQDFLNRKYKLRRINVDWTKTGRNKS